ncbi:MAG TPA: proton-conducting transporter membrane subunit [Candidatus Dormibacteraeota bacterium]|nr:proton-conducting transporter membrane subunit [Candidatus Dormibacteraeota bacterium]
MSFPRDILVFVVLAPGAMFAILASLWMVGWTPSERVLTWLTGATFLGCTLGVAALAWTILAPRGPSAVVVTFGNWFSVGDYHFPLVFIADRLSLPFLALAAVLSGLIGQFSATYLHRDSGFLRFFLFLHLFAFGSLLAFASGSFDLLAAGWEIVGITSVLLIGFFQLRPAPVENGLRVFGIYRACDIGLFLGVFAMHHWAGTASFDHGFPILTGKQALIVSLLLLLAASGKAAQVPFSGWLPRAMEGPTPSSAIFYGAISIHAGAFLLLRAQPLLAQSAFASTLVILIGAATAIHGTIVGRASADAKTSLAYATLTQVGVVFIEIGLGWKWLAVAHILGNATVRTMQYLRAPSMLHDYHQMHSAIGSEVAPTGKQIEELLPEGVQLWLYRWAFDRGHLDTILDRWVIAPLLQASAYLAKGDRIGGRSANMRRFDVTPITLPGPVGPRGE